MIASRPSATAPGWIHCAHRSADDRTPSSNEIENRRKREHDRLEALGDRAGLDSLWAQERRRSWPSRNLRRTLAWVVWGMRDPATIRLLAEARGDGHSLSVFGGGAVSPILALTDVHAYRDQITALLRDMARIATQGELPVESRDATARAVQGFLGGETLRTMQIADPHGIVLSAAIDLAIALGTRLRYGRFAASRRIRRR